MANRRGVRYVPTGVAGFDAITGGGLPAGRITVVVGGPGSGKTIFAAQTLAAGARDFGEPGIFVAFEEPPQQGEFDLLGLLAIIGAKAKALRAKRIVLDGLDVLLEPLGDPSLVRREVFRLREWLQNSGTTAIITAKSDVSEARLAGEYDFLPFMADCVVTLQHRTMDGLALRFLRVSKCRGGAHSSNEFPFSLTRRGIEVGAGVQSELKCPVSSQRVSSGVARLDAMLSGGYYRGSSTLVTGAPGTSKTTLGAAFVQAACGRRERTLFVSFNESPEQIVRNVASVGIRLAPHVKSGLLRMCSLRSRAASPEAHVAYIRSLLREHRSKAVVFDPLSALVQSGGSSLAEGAAIHLLDLAKATGITSLSTSLLGDKSALSEETPLGISTIADTWIHLTYVNQGGERNRALTIIKSRGTSHSNQVRELVLSGRGVTLTDVYAEGGEVLMGTLRWQKETERELARERALRDASLRQREAELALAEVEARVQTVAGERAVRSNVVERSRAERESTERRAAEEKRQLRARRGADGPPREQRKRAQKELG